MIKLKLFCTNIFGANLFTFKVDFYCKILALPILLNVFLKILISICIRFENILWHLKTLKNSIKTIYAKAFKQESKQL